MRCKHCNARLAPHDIWCVNCRRRTQLVTNELAATKSLAKTWQTLKQNLGINVPLAAVAALAGIIPIAVIIWILNSILVIPQHTVGSLLLSLFTKAITISIFMPFTLLGFHAVSLEEGYSAGRSRLKDAFKAYPRYLLFSLLNSLYFVIIYLICFGFPGFGSDPILRLVWIVLVNYWVAVVLPLPIVMERRQLGFFTALRLVYRHFQPVRWNLYLLALILAILNSVAALLLIFPLVFTLPLTWYAIRDYTDLLLEYELDLQ